jgi:hypothetical protein
MRFYGLILGILGVWRVTHLVQAEDGPGDAIVRLRRLVGDGFWGSLLDCFQCLSVWVAAPFALVLGASGKERFLLWPAFSAGAILLERLTTREPTASAPYWQEEDPDAMLREEETGPRTDESGGR